MKVQNLMDPLPPDADRQAEEIVDWCRLTIKGRHPMVTSAALGNLLAMWLISLPEPVRADLMTAHMTAVRDMLPQLEKDIWGASGHPFNGLYQPEEGQ